jgi:MFS family permease
MRLSIKRILSSYPRQFWLVVMVMTLAYMFHSILWPFLIIYASQKLGLALTAVTGLLTLNSLVGLITTFMGGAIADRFGRKWVMVTSLLLCGVSWFLFQYAESFSVFVLLMALNGATTPMYRLAADAMMADIVPVDQRMDAYSILRMGNNLGVALGPAIGGYLSAISYDISFSTAGIGIFAIGLAVAIFSLETLPAVRSVPSVSPPSGGYTRIVQDSKFMGLVGSYSLNRICSSTLWMLLAVYAKQNFGVSERLYGFIPTTNAVMVILFQILITRQVKRHRPEKAMIVGAIFYAVSVFAVAFGRGFWAFWLCMVVATIGEMILVPTSTTYASLLAPEDMRGRYMSIYTLTGGLGTGIGPLIGGIANDTLGPHTIWYSGGAIGGFSALAFFLIFRQQLKKPAKSTRQGNM